ncbi:MAG: phosphoenolpyruvate--protein phosphotransferase [Chromatiales bacterium]|nr:phosphoenolpyruvate--protein phosphotransferase [Chromatiales bacterium]
MLDILRRIVQKVNAAQDLDCALEIIVKQVKRAISADVCSVYLTDIDQRNHVLMATDGLLQEAVGKVKIPLHRGLIGLVCERAELLNLDDASSHPRYLRVIETGEASYKGFLGVPIIQHRKVLGVLVVRQEAPRCFGDNEVTFLFTLAAQLAGAIIHAQASGELVTHQSQAEKAPIRFLQGRPGSTGVAIGTAVVAFRQADLDAVPDRSSTNTEEDIKEFHVAVGRVQDDLRQLKERLSDDISAEDRALFDALLLMLSGDTLVSHTVDRINKGEWVQSALHHTIEEHTRAFDSMDDPYLRERGSDVRDLGRRILHYLQTGKPREVNYPDKTILVGDDVSAVDLAEISKERLVGIISAKGSSSSHVAILARAMGVPAVMGVTDLPASRVEGCEVILDGYRGRVYIAPAPAVKQEYERLAKEDQELSREMEALRGEPSETTDGVLMPLYLNTGLVSEMSTLGADEAEGVGLYRTEFPFMVRDRFPGEEVQITNYTRILDSFTPRPVVLRTLDIGGDKPLPYFPISEPNPFLGWRGIRISLDHPEIFLTQIRAMLRAGIGHNNLQIMLPMISSVPEVDELLMLIQRAHDELMEEGYVVSMPRVGVMIEVPSAVYQIEELARRVDFISIGTNDLTQYLLAVDRNNAFVAELYDDLHPAVLRALVQIVDGAKKYGRPISVCGEMAGNPLACVLLLGMGVDSLSMSAGSLLKVKWVIRSFSRTLAKQHLRSVLRMEDPKQVRNFMTSALEDMGLAGLVRPGK